MLTLLTPSGYTITVPGQNNSELPLYLKYPGQGVPQGTCLSISSERAWWETSGAIGGGMSEEAFHGRVQQVPCAPTLTFEELVWFSEELAPLIELVIEGLDDEWDGNNRVGILTDEAADALEEIESTLEPEKHTDSLEVWEPAEWLDGTSNSELLVDLREAGSLEALIAEIEASALSSGQVIVGSIEDEIRDRLACRCPECNCDSLGEVEDDDSGVICEECEGRCFDSEDAD